MPTRTESVKLGGAMLDRVRFADLWKLSVYDAAYVELAQRLGAEFWTVDEPCRKKAHEAGVKAP